MTRVIVGVLLTFGVLAATPQAYGLLGYQWPAGSVIRYNVNTDTIVGETMTPTQMLSAVQSAAQAWNDLKLPVSFVYGGPSTEVALDVTAMSGANSVFFSPIVPANGPCCFTQNWKTSTGVIVESDTQMAMAVALEPGLAATSAQRTFLAEDQTCDPTKNGQYVRTIMTHEFGHVLGIGHSTDPAATMNANIAICSLEGITLEPDDIAAARALYPSASPEPAPVPPPAVDVPLLTVRAYKVKGVKRADLVWENIPGASVDIYRDAAVIRRAVLNAGSATDDLGTKGGGSATYRVCESGTTACASARANW